MIAGIERILRSADVVRGKENRFLDLHIIEKLKSDALHGVFR